MNFNPPIKLSSFIVKHNGNITFDEVISIARIMRCRSQSRFLIGTVKEILGTCMVKTCMILQVTTVVTQFNCFQSVGCTIDGRTPREVTDAVANGELEVPEE